MAHSVSSYVCVSETEVNKSQYVVHSGYIRNKQKLGYRVLWGALVRESAAGPKRIAFYDTPAEFLTDIQPHLSLEFNDIVHVQLLEVKERPKVKRPYPFQIITTSSKHQFATKTAGECQKWVDKITNMLQGIPEPDVVYEFQIAVLPGGLTDKLNLSGSYILKISDSSLKLFTANGALPTHFHCSLSSISSVHCTSTCINVCGSKSGLLMIQTSSNADFGEGSLAFSTRSAADINRVIECRRNLIAKASHKALALQAQALVSDHASAIQHGLPCSGKFHPPAVQLPHTLPAGVSLHQFPPSNPKSQRMSAPNLSDHLQDFNGFISGNYDIPTQPRSPMYLQSPKAPSKGLKPTLPPKPLPKPRSPNLSRGQPHTGKLLSPCSHMNVPDSHSSKHVSDNETPSSTPTNQSNTHRHKLKHINSKPDAKDSAKHLPPLTPPPPPPPPQATTTTTTTTTVTKKVVSCRVGQQGIEKFPQTTIKERSKNVADRKRASYSNKTTGGSGSYDFEPVEEWIGNRKLLGKAAVGESTVDELLPLIAFQSNRSQEINDDSSHLSLVVLQGSKFQGTTEVDSPPYLVLQGNTSQEPRSGISGDIEKTDQSCEKIGSSDGSESVPHKQSMAKVKRSNSDLSSRGTVMRKGTIKVYKDPLDTISIQRQLSVEDLTSMCNHSNSPQNHDQYPSSKHSGGVQPYATFKYEVGEEETLPYSELHWNRDQVNCTSGQPTLPNEMDTSERTVLNEDEGYDYVRRTAIYTPLSRRRNICGCN